MDSIIKMHPVTLRYTHPGHEGAYRQWASQTSASGDRVLQTLHLGVMLFNLGVPMTAKYGTLFCWQSAKLILPYWLLAIVHYIAARQASFNESRAVSQLLFEAGFLMVCLFQTPAWFLSPATGSSLKTMFFGTGVASGFWFAFLSNKPWAQDIWSIPLWFILHHWYLSSKTCAALESTAQGRQFISNVGSTVDVLMRKLTLYPAFNDRPCTCMKLAVNWQLQWAVQVLSIRYYMDYRKRQQFLHVMNSCPPQPKPATAATVTHVILHLLITIRIASEIWVQT